jgi:hypothetical protein
MATKTSLTQEQQQLLSEYYAEMCARGLSTEPADRATAENAITRIYAASGRSAPRFFWYDSPFAAVAEQRKIRGLELGDCFWGSFELYWTAFYTFPEMALGVQYDRSSSDLLANWHAAALSAGWWYPYEHAVFVCERPIALHVEKLPNGQIRLHHSTERAMLFRDGTGVCAIHGVRVPPDIVLDPASITPDRIKDERNAEVRRVMIDKFGADRYFRAIDAEVVDTDTDQYGFPRRLLSADVGDIEPLVMIEMVDSSPLPINYIPDVGANVHQSGRRFYKKYMLRVDPNLRPLYEENDDRGRFGEPQRLTAHNAVASLAGLRGEEYAPTIES